MTTLFSDLRTRIAKRNAYIRTVRALREMPRATAQDLDIFPEDAEATARRIVYGR